MITFIQHRVCDTPREICINRPEDVETMARKLQSAGVLLEAEILATGEVSLTAERTDDEGETETLAHEICKNLTHTVSEAVDRLIRKATACMSNTTTEGGSSASTPLAGPSGWRATAPTAPKAGPSFPGAPGASAAAKHASLATPRSSTATVSPSPEPKGRNPSPGDFNHGRPQTRTGRLHRRSMAGSYMPGLRLSQGLLPRDPLVSPKRPSRWRRRHLRKGEHPR